MKRLVTFVLTLILGIFIGYWINDHALGSDTWPIQQLSQLSDRLDPQQFALSSRTSQADASTEPVQLDVHHDQAKGRTVILEDGTRAVVPDPDTIDYVLLEDLIIDRVNALRHELGLQTVYQNQTLTEASRLRAQESAVSFSHTRPDGRDPFTVLTQDYYYPYRLVGENLGMATLINDEVYMADWLMEGWINSPDHYDTMVNPNFNEIGVGAIHSDGAIYATQLFGLQ